MPLTELHQLVTREAGIDIKYSTLAKLIRRHGIRGRPLGKPRKITNRIQREQAEQKLAEMWAADAPPINEELFEKLFMNSGVGQFH